jgi:O-antigen ligase
MTMSAARQKIHDQIFTWSCLALAFFLPVYQKILPPLIAVMFLNWLVAANFRYIPLAFKEKRRGLTLSFAALYILYMFGMLYSENRGSGLFDLEVKLSMLLFPLIFSTMNGDFPVQAMVRKVLIAFVAGCLTATLLLLCLAVYSWSGTGDPVFFFYTHLSRFIHPSYISMYLNLSVAVLAYFLVRNEEPSSRKVTVMRVLLLLWFALFIFLLSSKAGIFSLMFIALMLIAYAIGVQKQTGKGILWLVLVAGLFYGAFSLFPSTATRFRNAETALAGKNKSSPEQVESNSERLVVWHAALEVIKENPVFGVGTGDVKDALMEEYQKEHKLGVYNMRLNAHNQYLQTYIALGIPGALLLVILLIIPGWMAVRRLDMVCLAFLVVFAFNILVESMLEVQAGVIFYSFFNVLFFFGLKSLPARPGTGKHA